LKDSTKLKELLLFHVHEGKLNPTRNARTFNSMMLNQEDQSNKQLTVKVASWTMEKFIMTGQPNHAKIVSEGIKCDNGLIHVLSEVLIPYKGTEPPGVTFMGARDIKGEATLQTGFEGDDIGYFAQRGFRDDDSKDFMTLGETWKEAANWSKNDAGRPGEGYKTNERGGDLSVYYKNQKNGRYNDRDSEKVKH